MTQTTFKAINLYDNFRFASSSDGFFNDRRVYRKLSARTYCAIDKTGGQIRPVYRVGSINAKCERA